MKVNYATRVLKQGTNIKTMCPNYILNLVIQSLTCVDENTIMKLEVLCYIAFVPVD